MFTFQDNIHFCHNAKLNFIVSYNIRYLWDLCWDETRNRRLMTQSMKICEEFDLVRVGYGKVGECVWILEHFMNISWHAESFMEILLSVWSIQDASIEQTCPMFDQFSPQIVTKNRKFFSFRDATNRPTIINVSIKRKTFSNDRM